MKRLSIFMFALIFVILSSISHIFANEIPQPIHPKYEDLGFPDHFFPDPPSLPPKEIIKDVFFNFNKTDISNDIKKILDENIETLKSMPRAEIILEGHTDERGTNMYNLFLGDFRAKKIKAYLVAAGVNDLRITTISYGEERPFVLGHEESAWKWNRRVHFVIRKW